MREYPKFATEDDDVEQMTVPDGVDGELRGPIDNGRAMYRSLLRRNAEIAIEHFLDGKSSQEIAEDRGMSRERVRQICQRYALTVLKVPEEMFGRQHYSVETFVSLNCVDGGVLVPYEAPLTP